MIGYFSLITVFLALLGSPLQGNFEGVLKSQSGKISFISEAPLETIEADSDELKGALDTARNSFAFSVHINSFDGFNSPLQQQHFNENYLESARYPSATFTGKIIETIDFSHPGKFDVRAKGVMMIHGVKAERIIRGTIEITQTEIRIKTSFLVLLEDHDIKIPRIVYQKVAPEVTINSEVVFRTSKS